MNAFQQFSAAVHARYNDLSKGELFRVDVEPDAIKGMSVEDIQRKLDELDN